VRSSDASWSVVRDDTFTASMVLLFVKGDLCAMSID
jgi:hypothetical protein